MNVAIHVAVPAAEADLAADALWQAGAAAIEERPGLLIAATDERADPAALLAAVAGRWPAEAVLVDLDGALDAWRRYARAVRVGGRLVVRPPWVDAPGGGGPSGHRVEVVIDPGRAFGHGAHATTRLALAALDDLVRGGERVLDVGCGSGVLAIAALLLGAGHALGVDIDPAAVAATAANAARNGVADRLVVAGDTAGLERVRGACDLVVANMLLPQLVSEAPGLAAARAPGGTVVVSGVLVEQRDDLVDGFGSLGLAPVRERVADGWLALTLRAG